MFVVCLRADRINLGRSVVPVQKFSSGAKLRFRSPRRDENADRDSMGRVFEEKFIQIIGKLDVVIRFGVN